MKTSAVVRYMWTATGLRPSDTQHGAARYINERDYDDTAAERDELREANRKLVIALERVTAALEYETTHGFVSAAGLGRYQGTLEVAHAALARSKFSKVPS